MMDYTETEHAQRQAAYRRFAAEAPDVPIFLQPYYLDAVCGPAHWSATLAFHGGRVVAALPFFLKKKLFWQYVAMPPLCRFMGPYLLPDYRTVRREIPLLRELIRQLPPLDAFEQDFHYSAANWLPFYWAGFRQTTRYSYVLALSDRRTLYANIKPSYRNRELPKAAACMQVEYEGDLSTFYRVHNGSYERQGLRVPFTFEAFERLDRALAAQGRRQLLWAVDRNDGTPHAVVYLIWDAQSAYYLLGGGSSASRNSGAGFLLAWEAICFALENLRVPVFDFLGSMIPSIELMRRRMGAQPKPYFRVQREWSLLWRVSKQVLR